ncbi:MAG: arginase family protein [Chloroflexota bacterium]|nr:arginase family protein [Chloroflexota bacterium]
MAEAEPAVYAGCPPCGPIIAVPTSAGVPQARGIRLGPAYILAQFDPQEYVLHRPRLGDASVEVVTEAVAVAVSRAVTRGLVPVVIGGDHTVALGSVLGAREGLRKHGRRAPAEGRHEASKEAPLFLLWLDAHPDLNTAETSPTGHLHGMVLGGLLGIGPLAVREPLTPEQVTLAGVRAADPGERSVLAMQPGLSLWDVETLRGDGWLPRIDALLERVRCAGGRLYVSVDLDVFDPGVAPGVAVPVAHGALVEPVIGLLRRIRASGLLAGADIVELFPPADRERQTARVAARVLTALGAAVTWRAWGDGGEETAAPAAYRPVLA